MFRTFYCQKTIVYGRILQKKYILPIVKTHASTGTRTRTFSLASSRAPHYTTEAGALHSIRAPYKLQATSPPALTELTRVHTPSKAEIACKLQATSPPALTELTMQATHT